MKKFKMDTREILELLRSVQIEKLDQLLVYNFLDEKSFSQILKDYNYNNIYYTIGHNHYITDGYSYFCISDLKQQQYLLKHKTKFHKLKEDILNEEQKAIYYNQKIVYDYINKDYDTFTIFDYNNHDNYCYYTNEMCNVIDDKFKIGDFNYNHKYLDMFVRLYKIKGFSYVQNKDGSLIIINNINQILAKIMPLK